MQLLSEGQSMLLSYLGVLGDLGDLFLRKVPGGENSWVPRVSCLPFRAGHSHWTWGPFHANLNEENSINTASSPGVSLAWGLKRNCFSVGTGQERSTFFRDRHCPQSDPNGCTVFRGHCPLSYDPSHLSSIALIIFMTVSQI